MYVCAIFFFLFFFSVGFWLTIRLRWWRWSHGWTKLFEKAYTIDYWNEKKLYAIEHVSLFGRLLIVLYEKVASSKLFVLSCKKFYFCSSARQMNKRVYTNSINLRISQCHTKEKHNWLCFSIHIDWTERFRLVLCICET